MIVLEKYDATPNTNILDVLGHSGYSLQAAIADIIDNSIAAKANNIWISMKYDAANSYITIVDDGFGMSLEKLKQASIIAQKNMDEKRDKDDLGRFSTGINSASSSVCNQLFIQSKGINSSKSNTVNLDFKLMKKEGWTCNVVDLEENYLKDNSGTAIIWKDLKKTATADNKDDFFKKIKHVETHISHVFCDYIKKGVKIFINDNLIMGWDPFLTNNPKTTIVYNNNQDYKGEIIGVKVYILPPFSNLSPYDQSLMKGYGLSEQQGFYIFRNNRLIKEGGWLDLEGLTLSNKYDYARIRIDVDSNLDKYFEPNFLKNEISIPDDLREYFKAVAIKARNESRNNFNYMKAPAISKGTKKTAQIPVWKCKNTSDGLVVDINREHPIVEKTTMNLTNKEKNQLFNLLSKNLPFKSIQLTGMSKNQNSYSNLRNEMEELYDYFKKEKMTNFEIIKKMTACEPFCANKENRNELIEFFDEMGLLDD